MNCENHKRKSEQRIAIIVEGFLMTKNLLNELRTSNYTKEIINTNSKYSEQVMFIVFSV